MRFPSRALQGAAQLPPCRHWDWDPSGQSEHLGQPGFTTTPSGHRAAAEVWGGRVLGHEGWWGAQRSLQVKQVRKGPRQTGILLRGEVGCFFQPAQVGKKGREWV